MTKFIAWGQRVDRHANHKTPGNSLALIRKAYELGYDGVEIDVQMAKDAVLVLMHDHTLDATTDRTGAVNTFTSDELRTIRLKGSPDDDPAYVEKLEAALKTNGERGCLMLDSYHMNPSIVSAIEDAVAGSKFDPARFLLLTYTREGGKLLKAAFPQAVVLLKSPHDVFPPKLTSAFSKEAIGLDGVLVPVIGYPDSIIAFRAVTSKLGLRLAVYLHGDGVDPLVEALESEVDFVTSDNPSVFDEARTKFLTIQTAIYASQEGVPAHSP